MRSNFREGTAGCGRGGPGSATLEGDQRDESLIDLGNSSRSRSGKWRIAEEAEKPRVKRRRAVRLGRFLEREIALAHQATGIIGRRWVEPREQRPVLASSM